MPGECSSVLPRFVHFKITPFPLLPVLKTMRKISNEIWQGQLSAFISIFGHLSRLHLSVNQVLASNFQVAIHFYPSCRHKQKYVPVILSHCGNYKGGWLLTTKPLLWTPSNSHFSNSFHSTVVLFAKCVLFKVLLSASTHNHIW